MSQSEFEKRIKQLKNQLHTLMLARRGALTVKKIDVRAHDVPAYHVNKHTRLHYARS